MLLLLATSIVLEKSKKKNIKLKRKKKKVKLLKLLFNDQIATKIIVKLFFHLNQKNLLQNLKGSYKVIAFELRGKFNYTC